MQIWTGMFDTSKSNKSNNSDGGSKQSSASSTMQSTDSGCATMYSPSMIFSVQEKFPRPITIGPEYMNMMEATSKDKTNHGEDYINLFACSTVGKRTPPPPPKCKFVKNPTIFTSDGADIRLSEPYPIIFEASESDFL